MGSFSVVGVNGKKEGKVMKNWEGDARKISSERHGVIGENGG